MLAYEPHYESANDLVKNWKGGYRYGFPDFIAIEPPVRPMDYYQGAIYSGVIGRHYPNAQTRRYYYMFDPNLYEVGDIGSGLGDVPSSSTATLVPAATPGGQLTPEAKALITKAVIAASVIAVGTFTIGAFVGARYARRLAPR